MDGENPKTTAAIAGHPLHPMLVPFPIALFTVALIADIVFWRGADPFWSRVALWSLGGGLVFAAAAAMMGLTDFVGERRIRSLRQSWLHMGGNVVLVLIEAVNLGVHYGSAAAIVSIGLILSIVAVVLMLFNGWMGWEMVYRDRVGVSDSHMSPAGHR
jgi:uncharacterized membrane protein